MVVDVSREMKHKWGFRASLSISPFYMPILWQRYKMTSLTAVFVSELE